MTCCIFYNYLISVDLDDALLAQVNNRLEDEAHEEHHRSEENNEETTKGEIIRDAIAAEMWVNYVE